MKPIESTDTNDTSEIQVKTEKLIDIEDDAGKDVASSSHDENQLYQALNKCRLDRERLSLLEQVLQYSEVLDRMVRSSSCLMVAVL